MVNAAPRHASANRKETGIPATATASASVLGDQARPFAWVGSRLCLASHRLRSSGLKHRMRAGHDCRGGMALDPLLAMDPRIAHAIRPDGSEALERELPVAGLYAAFNLWPSRQRHTTSGAKPLVPPPATCAGSRMERAPHAFLRARMCGRCIQSLVSEAGVCGLFTAISGYTYGTYTTQESGRGKAKNVVPCGSWSRTARRSNGWS